MKTYARFIRGPLVAAVISLLGHALFGADAVPPAQLLAVTVTEVKPDKVAEFERIQKEEVTPLLKQAGYTERYAFARAQFGEGYRYTFSTPIKDYAHYDNPSAIVKAIGQPAVDALNAKLAACVISTRTVAYRFLPAISVPTTDDRKVCVLTIHHLAPGRKAEWIKYWSESILPAIKQAALTGYNHYEVQFGGDPNEIASLTWVKDYADLDQGPALTRSIGAKAASDLTAKLPPGVIVSDDRSLMRLREDLSIQPEKKPVANSAK